VLAEESIIFKNNIVMILTIIIAFAALFFGFFLGFIIAGLMAEARRSDDAEEKWMKSEKDDNDNGE
jgi:uncharacterized membrane-anchored protein YhcB (DUF1043 family)